MRPVRRGAAAGPHAAPPQRPAGRPPPQPLLAEFRRRGWLSLDVCFRPVTPGVAFESRPLRQLSLGISYGFFPISPAALIPSDRVVTKSPRRWLFRQRALSFVLNDLVV